MELGVKPPGILEGSVGSGRSCSSSNPAPSCRSWESSRQWPNTRPCTHEGDSHSLMYWLWPGRWASEPEDGGALSLRPSAPLLLPWELEQVISKCFKLASLLPLYGAQNTCSRNQVKLRKLPCELLKEPLTAPWCSQENARGQRERQRRAV